MLSFLRHSSLLGVPCTEIVRIILWSSLDLTSQLLKRFPLRLGNEQSGEDTGKHESSVDLHDMVEPGGVARTGCSTASSEGANKDLCDNRPNFSRSGGDTVSGASVSCREDLAWNDECRSIRAEVEEELGKDVES